MGTALTTLLLDTHALQWWSAEPDRLSRPALAAIEEADELALASVSWFELAWLAEQQRIVLSVPVRAWLAQLAVLARTVIISPTLAASAAGLPASFPADRLSYASALELGLRLVTKDERLRRYPRAPKVTVW